jgi:hypothetical protein
MIRLATSLSRRLINSTRIAERATESIVFPFERKPPIPLVIWTLSYSALWSKVIHRVVRSDVY